MARHRAALGADNAANPAELRAISSSLDTVAKSIRQATGEAEVSAALRQLDEADQRISQAEAEAQQNRQSAAAERLDHLSKVMAGIEPTARQRFDPAGTAATNRLIGELKALAERDDIAAFSARADGAAAAVSEHVRVVTEGLAKHADLSRQLTARHADLAGRIADLESDAAAASVPLGDLGLAADTLDYIADKLNADDLEEAAGLAARLGDRLNGLERDLDLAIDRLTARREMLGAIIDALPRLGFAVDPASMIESPDGAIGIQATRSSGASLAVVVQDNDEDEHRVSYLTEASLGQAPGVSEMSAGACDSLIALAEAVNTSIGTAGFDVGQVTWDDQGDRPPPGHGARRPVQPARSRERRIGEQ